MCLQQRRCCCCCTPETGSERIWGSCDTTTQKGSKHAQCCEACKPRWLLPDANCCCKQWRDSTTTCAGCCSISAELCPGPLHSRARWAVRWLGRARQGYGGLMCIHAAKAVSAAKAAEVLAAVASPHFFLESFVT